MKNLIVPFTVKKQNGKLTRLICNDNEKQTYMDNFTKEIRTIYNSIPNIEVPFNKILGDVINSNFTENHYLLTINKTIQIAFVNVNKIPAYHSIDTIGNSLLNS
jgi:hypothetical protein